MESTFEHYGQSWWWTSVHVTSSVYVVYIRRFVRHGSCDLNCSFERSDFTIGCALYLSVRVLDVQISYIIMQLEMINFLSSWHKRKERTFTEHEKYRKSHIFARHVEKERCIVQTRHVGERALYCVNSTRLRLWKHRFWRQQFSKTYCSICLYRVMSSWSQYYKQITIRGDSSSFWTTAYHRR